MQTTNYNNLEILVRGRPITEFFHKGKTYVEGRKGSDYVIRFRNNSGRRKKVIVSVDGLNVISGDINWSNGYVVDPWGVIDIPGWRKDNNNVAKFKFSSIGKSYNQHNENGDEANVGVIGVKVYPEQFVWSMSNWSYYSPPLEIKHVYHHHDWNYPYYVRGPYYSTGISGLANSNSLSNNNINVLNDGHSTVCDTVAMASGASASATEKMAAASYTATMNLADIQPQNAVEQSLGTEYGKNAEFKTSEVNYNFNAVAEDTLLIYYDTREGLERRGIDMHRRVYNKTPDAFPTYSGVHCPPPR